MIAPLPGVPILELKEIPFSFQAASEPTQASIFPHHSMARNEDRHWVSPRGGPNSPDCVGRTGPFGQVRIVDGFTIGDERDLVPDPLLEIGAGQAQRDREAFPLSREIFLELFRRLLKNRVFGIEFPAATRGGKAIAADKIKSD